MVPEAKSKTITPPPNKKPKILHIEKNPLKIETQNLKTKTSGDNKRFEGR